jgi:bifunctional non-homologous end joining protein LigD
MTREGIVRHAVFHGLRDDKPATAIDLERAMPTKRAAQTEPENLGTLRLTHPDRVVDATTGATKRGRTLLRSGRRLAAATAQGPACSPGAGTGWSGRRTVLPEKRRQLHIPKVLSYSKAQAGQAAMVLNRADSLLGAVQMNA